MKSKLLSMGCFAFIFFVSQSALASPPGNLVIHNASDKTISAQVSNYGKFDIAANEQKSVAYSTLEYACSATPTHCTARFYVDNRPAGSAMINAVTGKLVYVKLGMKVRTAKSNQVLRSVVIQ